MNKVNVFLTVDVECSIGGAFADRSLSPVGGDKRIFGRFGGREYGIGLIMDIAEQYGLPVTFFVETFQEHYFGSQYTQEVVEAVLRRHHDIQLHLHPNYLNFGLKRPQDLKFSDLCGKYSFAEQVEIIDRAARKLVAAGAPKPVAFRAGCFGADMNTLKALKVNGFRIDSSYNQAYLGVTCRLPDRQLNDAAPWEGIFEFPITHFFERSGVRPSRYMPLDINGVSFQEMRFVLNAARSGNGPRNIVIILHSFSFIKPYDVQYEKVRIRKNVISRYRKLCQFLGRNSSSFRVRTFRDMVLEDSLQEAAKNAHHVWPKAAPHITWVRLAEQAMDRLL